MPRNWSVFFLKECTTGIGSLDGVNPLKTVYFVFAPHKLLFQYIAQAYKVLQIWITGILDAWAD